MRDYDRKGLLNLADNDLLYTVKYFLYTGNCEWAGVVGTGTFQDQDGQETESRCGARFSALS